MTMNTAQIQIVSILKATVLTMFLAITSMGWAAEQGSGPSKSEVKQEQKTNTDKVNINTAGEKALDTLPRIGPAIAKRIIEFRKENGPFESIEELMNVKGIGEKTFEKLKPLISI